MFLFGHYLRVGFEHVIPLGYDHILFIISLFFFDSKLKTAVIQCSIFTVAHSLTLALVALSYLKFDTRLVETVIALSIFFIAFENLFSAKLKAGRLCLVFIFGLLHGMGFATALNEIGLPKNEFLTALVGFNCGVEVAQVVILLVCYLMIAKWIRDKDWYSSMFVRPLSMGISLVALFWAIERYLSN